MGSADHHLQPKSYSLVSIASIHNRMALFQQLESLIAVVFTGLYYKLIHIRKCKLAA